MAEIPMNFNQDPVTVLGMQSLKPKAGIRPFHGGEAEHGRKLRIEVAPVCQLVERGEIMDLIVVSRFRLFEGVTTTGYSRQLGCPNNRLPPFSFVNFCILLETLGKNLRRNPVDFKNIKGFFQITNNS